MRIRFAPSPTGYLHIGNARTAIINHLIARKTGAEFILRIEDTDLERSTRESEESILFDLKWLGISWCEGPDLGGPYAPYRQSERFDIYRSYTEKLLASGKAYHCYCSQEELDAQRAECEKNGTTFVYPGTCGKLSDAQKKEKESAGRKPTVRLHVPAGESIDFDDAIKGPVKFSSENIGGDFIIVRSDGVPIFNYIVVIDDVLMKVTHVIRGEDHLPNTPKQIMVARALGFESPRYAHLPLVLGNDKKKLSKRHGITSVENYRSAGYLSEALVNYIAMLGWASESGDEILPRERLSAEIDLSKLGKSAAVFDFQKLKWMNGQYIRNYDLEKIADLFVPYLRAAGYDMEAIERAKLLEVVALVRGKCDLLADIPAFARLFLEEIPEPDAEAAALLGTEEGKRVIAASRELIGGTIHEGNFLTDYINCVKEKTGLKGKNLFHPVRALLTSSLAGPDLAEAMKVLGFTVCMKRIEAIAKRYL
jgi:nondiscriminating glutamyl-tRNA synthetase